MGVRKRRLHFFAGYFQYPLRKGSHATVPFSKQAKWLSFVFVCFMCHVFHLGAKRLIHRHHHAGNVFARSFGCSGVIGRLRIILEGESNGFGKLLIAKLRRDLQPEIQSCRDAGRKTAYFCRNSRAI